MWNSLHYICGSAVSDGQQNVVKEFCHQTISKLNTQIRKTGQRCPAPDPLTSDGLRWGKALTNLKHQTDEYLQPCEE